MCLSFFVKHACLLGSLNWCSSCLARGIVEYTLKCMCWCYEVCVKLRCYVLNVIDVDRSFRLYHGITYMALTSSAHKPDCWIAFDLNRQNPKVHSAAAKCVSSDLCCDFDGHAYISCQLVQVGFYGWNVESRNLHGNNVIWSWPAMRRPQFLLNQIESHDNERGAIWTVAWKLRCRE